MHRTIPVLALVSAGISMGYGCTGTANTTNPTPTDPCAGITCTGHGTCAVTSAELPICACDQDFHAQGLDCVSDVPVADAPVVTLVANPTTVNSGGTTTLTWSSTNATSCTASGAWSGSRATSGSEESNAIAATSTFTLACTGPGGTTQRSATVHIAGDGLLLFDDFEYVVSRDDPAASSEFMAHGWTGCKTMQSGEPGARGYLYTADAIPGFAGTLPGGGGRVLAIEALPGTLGFQTDFYLQYGVGADPAYDNTIPANVWFQFWVYINHYGDQLSRIDEGKLIYSCNGTYPCQENRWLFTFGAYSQPPHFDVLGAPSDLGAYLQHDASAAPGHPIINPYSVDERWKFGQDDISEYMAVNRWTLVKIHVDTTGPGGVYEAWMRPQGGAWLKVAEYIDGVSPVGFVWQCSPGGSRVFRMPTTIGSNTAGASYDMWMYMDDFAMATSEAALPVYP